MWSTTVAGTTGNKKQSVGPDGQALYDEHKQPILEEIPGTAKEQILDQLRGYEPARFEPAGELGHIKTAILAAIDLVEDLDDSIPHISVTVAGHSNSEADYGFSVSVNIAEV